MVLCTRLRAATSGSRPMPRQDRRHFIDVTDNGPQGSINPNQFPISSVATDSSDASGNDRLRDVMGFTGDAGHVWKTTNAGATWTDFTANLPDSPVNAVCFACVDAQVYVGHGRGSVRAVRPRRRSWTELGPLPASARSGFLAQRRGHRAGDIRLGRQATAARIHLRAGNVAIRSGHRDCGLSDERFPILRRRFSPERRASFSGTASALNGYTSSRRA